jgi:hypothetical protein
MARRGSTIEVEITEGAIRVRSHQRVLTIVPTQPPADIEEDADFYIELDEIEYWDEPHDETAIDIDELQKIIEAIEEQVDKHGLSVVFD